MKFGLESLEDIKAIMRELSTGLLRLSFEDNFESFEKTITLTAGQELEIRNELSFIPSKYIIYNQSGNGLITKESEWTKNLLYLTNNGAVSVSATVTFMR